MNTSFRARLLSCVWVIGFAWSGASQSEPVDEYVLELYGIYCVACHSVEGTGAPMSFDASQWANKLANGLEPLVNNAIQGVGNMPAQGGCMECSYEDFEDLINYMTQAKPQ